jgi:hypothetical protein
MHITAAGKAQESGGTKAAACSRMYTFSRPQRQSPVPFAGVLRERFAQCIARRPAASGAPAHCRAFCPAKPVPARRQALSAAQAVD